MYLAVIFAVVMFLSAVLPKICFAEENTFLTPSTIARESLMILKNNCVLPALVHRDYENEFVEAVGDTVTIRRPATFEAKEFDASVGTVNQNAKEKGVPVTLDKLLDVTIPITSKELTFNIQKFNEQVLTPAMAAFLQKMDTYIAAEYKKVPYYSTSSSTAAFADLAGPMEILNKNKAPMENRSLVMGATSHAKYVVLDEFKNAAAAGSTDGLRNASMGRVLGFATYMDQNIGGHTKGTHTYSSAITLTASAAAGATQIAIGASTLDGTMVEGDTFTIAGISQQFVVTELATANTNAIAALKIYPALPVAVSSGTVLTTTAATTVEENIAFHRNAFALVTRSLALPLGNKNAYVASSDGFAIRVVFAYDSKYKLDNISFDMVCGVKTLTPELACRLRRS